MLSMSDFIPVTLKDRPFFSAYYHRFPQIHSDNTFTNMVCWNHFAHYEYAHSDDNIILSSTIEGQTKFRPPIGPRNPELLEDLIEICVRYGDEAPLVLVDEDAKSWITQIYPDLPLHTDRNYFEYVYRTADLSGLPGGNYLSVRRQLNKFRRNCHPEVEEITPENAGDIEDFLIEWCEWKDCDSEPYLAHEKGAVFYAVAHLGELSLQGLLIRVAGKVGAIALYEPLNADTAVVHFEKGLPDCEGIYKAINQETALRLRGQFEYINRESDMGVAGLREAKMRYHPHHLVEVYYASRKDLQALL